MLRFFVECKLQTDFLLIEDKENVSCQDLFVSFLTNCNCDKLIKKINLICYENPPTFYLEKFKNEKITFYNYFSDPCGWNNSSIESSSKTDLGFFTSDPKDLNETAFFIDSLSLLAHYQGFCGIYRNLCVLKKYCKKIVCIVHGDLFSSDQMQDLYFLTTTFIKLKGISVKKNFEGKIVELVYKKPGGRIINQEEVFFIDSDFKISSRSKEANILVLSNAKRDVENLTTFKLGLCMSKEERKAKDELILPYLKTKNQNEQEILYQPETYDLEDDPDDDLDI